MVALNGRAKKALFVEVKWKSLSKREVRGVVKDLERKADLVGLEGWEKSYGLMAKKVEEKEELRKEGWLVWDLEDFEGLTSHVERTGEGYLRMFCDFSHGRSRYGRGCSGR